jgi:hypothetical protein
MTRSAKRKSAEGESAGPAAAGGADAAAPDEATPLPPAAAPSVHTQGTTAGPTLRNVSASATTSAGTFRIIIRGIQQTDDAGRVIEAEAAADAFERGLSIDVVGVSEPVLRWGSRKQLIALDFDRPDGGPPVDENTLVQFFPMSLPQPLAAWPTHDCGLRVVFANIGEISAMALAGVWSLFAPLGPLVGWQIEAKTDTRHPCGERAGARCGRVTRFTPTAAFVVPGARGESVASDDEIADWLAERGLTPGRHGGEHCPWCGGATATCNACLVIDEQGAHCFRCGRRASWDALVGRVVADDVPTIYEAARACVHFPHQELILRDLRPNIPPELLQPAWTLMLKQAHADHLGDKDDDVKAAWVARIDRAASEMVDVVRSARGEWLDQKTLTVRKVSADRTLKHLPWSQSPIMVDAAANAAPLHGFTNVQPVKPNFVLGPHVTPPRRSVFVRCSAAPNEPPPVNLGLGPPPADAVEAAWETVESKLPGIDRPYVSTLLTAGFVAQRAVATPPLVIVTGRTGSGKTASQHLVAGMLGTKAGLVSLDGDAGDVNRRVGLKLADGCGFIFVDEVGRVKNLYWRLEPVLSANADLTFRAKYANEVETPFTAAVSLLGSTLPASIVKSPELSRRSVGIRLRGVNKDWVLEDDTAATDDPDQAKTKVNFVNARTIPSLRSALDIITASVWWTLRDAGPGVDWRQVCIDVYGALPLSGLDLLDAESDGREDAVRKLYEQFRIAKDDVLSQGTTWRGWLIAKPGAPTRKDATDLLGGLIDYEDRERQGGDIADLERLNLEAVLGFAEPQLVLRIQRRSGEYLIKFIEVGVAKGQGRQRSQFPPAIVPPKPVEDERERVEL